MAINKTNHDDFYHALIIMLSEGIGKLRTETYAGRFSRDLSGQARIINGNQVSIPARGDLTVSTKTESGPYSSGTPTGTEDTIATLAQKYVQWDITEQLLADLTPSAQADIIQGYISDAIVELADQLDSDFFATYANATNAVTNGGPSYTAMDDTTIIAAAKEMTNNRAPKTGRVLAVTNDIYHDDLLNTTTNPNFQTFEKVGSDTAVRNATLGMIRGFETITSLNMTGTSISSGTEHECLAFTPDAIAFVSKVLPLDPIILKQAEVRTVNEDGFELRLVWFYNTDNGSVTYRLEMYTAFGIHDQRKIVHIPIFKS